MASASPPGSSTSLLNNGVLLSQIDREASLIASLKQQEADWEMLLADKKAAAGQVHGEGGGALAAPVAG